MLASQKDDSFNLREFALVLSVQTSRRQKNTEQIAQVLLSVTKPNTQFQKLTRQLPSRSLISLSGR